MPVGAIVAGGAALIGAGATIYSSSQAGKAQKNAANQASDVELATATENNQLATDMYNANAERLDPYTSMGLAAGDQYLGLLLGDAPAAGSHAGSGWAPVAGTPAPATGSTGSTSGGTTAPAPPAYSGPSLTQILAMRDDGIPHNYENAMAAYTAGHSAAPAPVSTSALAPFGAAPAQPAPSALSPIVAQQAQEAIAAGADPAAVHARMAQVGASF